MTTDPPMTAAGGVRQDEQSVPGSGLRVAPDPLGAQGGQQQRVEVAPGDLVRRGEQGEAADR